jgi:hypothetical protein
MGFLATARGNTGKQQQVSRMASTVLLLTQKEAHVALAVQGALKWLG